MVQRFRALMLAFGLIALLAGLGSSLFAFRAAADREHDLRLAGASRVTALDDYAERSRAVTLLASHSAAFANFYRAPGTRVERITGRTGGEDLMPRVHTALEDLDLLFPDSLVSASFIDRSGAENARIVRHDPVDAADLDGDRRDAPFFNRAFALSYDQVFQSAPYRSESTGEWVISNAAKVNTGPGVSPAIVGFEVSLESFRLAFYSEDPDHRVRVVDLKDGRVVIDSTRPQDIGTPLGDPSDMSLRWVTTAPDMAVRVSDGTAHVVRHAKAGSHIATTWAVVVSTPESTGLWASSFSLGPIGLVLFGLLLLALSTLGYMGYGRSIALAARRDELTGLLNRRAARECAESLLARGDGLGVLLLDLDRFKNVNDSLGHHAGDQLLRVVAQRLAEVVREPDDVVARLGGDEFVVLARGVHDDESAGVLCERLTKAITAPVTIDGLEVSVGASIGIALAPVHGSDYGTLLQRADIAMYDAKGRRAGWQVFRDDHSDHDRSGLALDAELRRAVSSRELLVHFQPSFSVATGAPTRVEALVRWAHPTRGLLMPGHFIPFAEASGAIAVVTAEVLRLALDQAVEWAADGFDIAVAVNVSAHDVTDPTFADLVAEALAARGLPGSSLMVELTETALLADPEAASMTLWRLARSGVQVAIDDFGSGYASLLYLRRFPVTVLKLDRSLVQGLIVDATDATLVRWTIEMAHALRVTCIAEGIEDPRTLAALGELGCDEAQGFHLQVPVPAEELALVPVSDGVRAG